ncbi:hypothetical protein [Alloactinosynnema sp. L-07]|nr:hypothetical protein [Alloactinosynnema sp. L-07]
MKSAAFLYLAILGVTPFLDAGFWATFRMVCGRLGGGES